MRNDDNSKKDGKMSDKKPNTQVDIDIENVDIGSGGNLIKADIVNLTSNKGIELDHVRRAYLNFLSRDASRTNLPLGLPDIKGGDPSKNESNLGLKAVYVALETTIDAHIRRSDVRQDPGHSRLNDDIEKLLEIQIGPKFNESSKYLLIPFRQYLIEQLEKEVEINKIFKTTNEQIFQRPLEISEVARYVPYLVILGQPGSGKSTFLSHLVVALSAHQLEPDKGHLDTLPCWSNINELLPIPLSLRDFVYSSKKINPKSLIKFAASQYEAKITFDISLISQLFEKKLSDGKALLLLDGLDEVPPKQRIIIKNTIELIQKIYPNVLIIVACRVLSYQFDKWKLDPSSFGVVTLAPFSQKKIDQFITVFYKEVMQKGYHTVKPIDELEANIRKSVSRKDLSKLARNPLLLTIMTLVHITRGELPNTRAVLYEEAVDWLLSRWAEKNRRSDTTIRKILEEEGSSINELEEVLRRIAYHSHGSTPHDNDATADIPENYLIKELRLLHPARELDESKIWALELVKSIKEQAGLLVAAGVRNNNDMYTFPHRTFQEYLAARHLVGLEGFSDNLRSHGRKGQIWHEIVLLAAGYKAQKDGIEAPITAAGKLCPKSEPNSDEDWRAIILAGYILLEINFARVLRSDRDEEVTRIRTRLAQLLELGKLSVTERCFAGNILSSLMDPRPGVEITSNGLPDISWVSIPKGSFKLNSGESLDITKTDAFEISKYPITNAQYSAAVLANIVNAPSYWGGDEPPAALRNHPVIWVSWFDALKYCDWLSEIYASEIRLPSSIEWSKAARGILDTRLWPWGNHPNVELANLGPSGISDTCSVGIFPLGDLDPWIDLDGGGPLDMSGNIEEWCNDFYSSYSSDRTSVEVPRKIVGGSFMSSVYDAMCVPKLNWWLPQSSTSTIGFRVVRI